MDEKTSRDSNTTMMALAALMFFAPLVHYMLQKKTLELTPQDYNFVRGYLKLGYINRVFLLIVIIAGIAKFFVVSSLLNLLYALCIGIVLVILIVGSICVLSAVSLHIQKDFAIQFYEVGDKKLLLLKFLPLYNIYARYQAHNFGNPNRWIKESLLWRTFFVLLAVTGHPLLLSVIIFLRLLRITTLMVGIDVLHIQAKSNISNLFFKNPEEIWGYVSGSLLFVCKKIGSIVYTPRQPITIQSCIQNEKDAYARLYDMKRHRSIRVEYIIGGGLLLLYRYIVRPDLSHRYSYLPLIIIGGRYLIMLSIRGYLPSPPIAREIWLIISAPIRLLVDTRTHAKT